MSMLYPIKKNQTVEEVFEIVLYSNLKLLEQFEPIALLGKDIEGVHKMRVSLRKMRSLFSTLKLILPKKLFEHFTDEMRYASSELEKARDLDVYIEENFNQKKRTDIENMMFELAMEHRQAAYKRVNNLIRGERFKKFKKLFTQWLLSKEWRSSLESESQKLLERNIEEFAIDIFDFHHNKLTKVQDYIHELDDEAMHKLRIKCKKFRYSTEFFASIFGDKMVSFSGYLKDIQSILGSLHDNSVMRELHEVLLERHENRQLLEFAKELEKKQEDKSKELKKQLYPQFKQFIKIKEPWLL